MTILKRKPKEPVTPRQHYGNDLDRLMGLSAVAGMGAMTVAYGLKGMVSLIEAGAAAPGEWAFNGALMALRLAAAAGALFLAGRVRKRLMQRAPVEEIVGPMTVYQEPQP